MSHEYDDGTLAAQWARPTSEYPTTAETQWMAAEDEIKRLNGLLFVRNAECVAAWAERDAARAKLKALRKRVLKAWREAVQ